LAWASWAGVVPSAADSDDAWPAAEHFPMMLRRRAGSLGQRVITTALGCGGASDRYIFASRHGELARTAGILGAVADGEMPSPAEFSMSVHHALAGLLSIHAGNRQGHTAVAAGRDTFGFGLLESLAVIATEPEASVLLAYYDAPLPEEYAELGDENDSGSLILVLQMSAPNGIAPVFAFDPIPAGRGAAVAPHQTALDFVRFLLNGTPSAHSAGTRMNWRWRRVS
jgi:hypothetical protein